MLDTHNAGNAGNAGNTRNTEAIVKLAEEKSLKARQRVREALRVLQEQGQAINFSMVCKAAKVSKTFLYDPRHADLAQEIRRLREYGRPASSVQLSQSAQSRKYSKHNKSETAKDAQIARIRERVQSLEQQVRTLQQENELLYGRLANEMDHMDRS